MEAVCTILSRGGGPPLQSLVWIEVGHPGASDDVVPARRRRPAALNGKAGRVFVFRTVVLSKAGM